MTELALDQVRWNTGLKSIDSEAVSKALRHSGRASDAGHGHDFLDAPPSGCAAPSPEGAVVRLLSRWRRRNWKIRSKSRRSSGGKST